MRESGLSKGIRFWFLCWGWLLSLAAFAGEPPPKGMVTSDNPYHNCADHLKPYREGKLGEFHLVSSGRDGDVFGNLQQAASKLFSEGGIAQKLGIAVPRHILTFVASQHMSQLAGLGRYAAPHWLDGANILKDPSLGTYEFVTPGCWACRSFYRDSVNFREQISIMMHVAGHNDFGAYVPYERIRSTSDQMADSLQLAEYMSELYQKYDEQEVGDFYLKLQSLGYVQDFVHGTFEDPSQFSPDKIAHRPLEPVDSTLGAAGYPEMKIPRKPTKNVLQAFVTNLPPTTPDWKREMARLYERVYRQYTAVPITKTVNEGWATLMMYLMAYHSEWIQDGDLSAFAQLIAPVTRPSFSNPYWMGLQSWLRLRERFFEDHPELNAVTPIEKDAAFVKWAHETVIGTGMDNYDFIRFALDEKWVRKYDLFLHREMTYEEMVETISKNPTHELRNIVLSRDWKRIVNHIARKVAELRWSFAEIELQNVDAFGRSVVELKHEVFENIPLKLPSAVKTLYQYTQMLGKPVSLETVLPVMVSQYDWIWNIFPMIKKVVGGMKPVRLEVDLKGKLTIYHPIEALQVEPIVPGVADALSKEPEKPEPQWVVYTGEEVAQLQEELDFFIEDHNVSLSEALLTRRDQLMRAEIPAEINRIVGSRMPLATHSKTASHALLKFADFLKFRMYRSAKLAAQGKIASHKTRRGVRFRVFPEVPGFDLDHRKAIKSNSTPAPVDYKQSIQASALGPDTDDESDIGQGPHLPGDLHPGRPPNEGGSGDGEGEGEDGEDGEPQPGEPGQKPGQGGGDPTEVEVSFDFWGKLLIQELGLPNLLPVKGQDSETDFIREGYVRKRTGDPAWERMIPDLIAKAQAIRKAKGLPFQLPVVGYPTLLKEALRLVEENDYIVPDVETEPTPIFNAVVVFVVDMSGSMGGLPLQLAKDFVYNAKSVLKALYPKVEMRFVAADTQAREFQEEEFFKVNLGGGTEYAPGFQMADDILKTYPDSDWNKFVFCLGDAGANDIGETLGVVERLYKVTRYMGFGWTIPHGEMWAVPGFVEGLRGYASGHQWFNIAEIRDQLGALMALKTFFPKEKK